MPRDPEAAARAAELAKEAARLTGFEVVAWRDMPIDPSVCGSAAEAGRPDFAHVVLATAADVPERDPRSMERALYLYRRTLSGSWDRAEEFYVASCSHKTVVYKGPRSGAVVHLETGSRHRRGCRVEIPRGSRRRDVDSPRGTRRGARSRGRVGSGRLRRGRGADMPGKRAPQRGRDEDSPTSGRGHAREVNG